MNAADLTLLRELIRDDAADLVRSALAINDALRGQCAADQSPRRSSRSWLADHQEVHLALGGLNLAPIVAAVLGERGEDALFVVPSLAHVRWLAEQITPPVVEADALPARLRGIDFAGTVVYVDVCHCSGTRSILDAVRGVLQGVPGLVRFVVLG